MTPQFAHAPQPGHWSILAYGGGEPLEFHFPRPRSRADIIKRGRFEARWYCRSHVRVRDFEGNVIYDGKVV